jgi:hypothetical protein
MAQHISLCEQVMLCHRACSVLRFAQHAHNVCIQVVLLARLLCLSEPPRLRHHHHHQITKLSHSINSTSFACGTRLLHLAGAFIIRRLVGIAHTADMDSIADADVRAACELRALRFGRHLLVQGAATYRDVRALTAAAAAARQVDGLPADTVAAAEAVPASQAAVAAS